MTSDSEAAQDAKVVVGLDGSPTSIDALRWALHYVSSTSGSVEVVAVWDWYKSPGWYTPVLAGLNPEGDAKRVLDKALASARSEYPNVPISGRVVQGHPSPALVAASKGASLLVVGCRGHGEFTGMLIGSVSEHCATHAGCPVLVYRDHEVPTKGE